MTLKNKVAIVAGGNSGIGMAIVLELARRGASVVIDYVAHPEATAKPEEIASLVAFLAGDGARYVTATTLFADGGLMHSSAGL